MAHLIDPCNPRADVRRWAEAEDDGANSEVATEATQEADALEPPRLRFGLVDRARSHECATGVDRIEAAQKAQLAARTPVPHRLPPSSLPDAPLQPTSAASPQVFSTRPARPDLQADAASQTRSFQPQRFHRSRHVASCARSLRPGMASPTLPAGKLSPGDCAASTGDLRIRLRWPRQPDHYSMHVLSRAVDKPSFHTQKSWRQLACPGSAVASSKRKVYDRLASPGLSDLPTTPHSQYNSPSQRNSPCGSPSASSNAWRRRSASQPPLAPAPLSVSWDTQGVAERELREQRGTNLGEAYPAPGEGNFQGMAGQQCPELFKIMSLKPQRMALSCETGYRSRMKALFSDFEPGKGG